MNRKTKIVVSVAGILIVTLALIGLTFGYYLTRINGNTNPKSISASTQKLELTYSDNSSEIIGDGKELVPSNEPIGSKTFTVTNNGGDTNYSVVLEDMSIKDATTNEETTFENNDFRYTLTCIDKSGNNCENIVIDQTVFPLSDGALINNDISKGDTHTYTLTLWYLNTDEDQSNDMGKSLNARINIIDPSKDNPYRNNRRLLAFHIINNAMTKRNGTDLVSTPKTNPAQETSSFLYKEKGSEEATKYAINISTIYQKYYWTYATNFEADKTTGNFSLINPKTCKYSDSDCISDLVSSGNNVYIVSGTAPNNSNSTDTMKNTTDLSNVYRVTVAPLSTTSTIKLEYRRINKKSYSTEKELSMAVDDYGTSYYYRGGVTDNYLELNNMCFRVVRIQGDGSIKLTLAKEGLCSSITETDIGSAYLKDSSSNNLYAVYGYDNTDSKYYFNYEGYTGDNGLYKVLNNWYNTKMISVQDKLKNETWCLGGKTSKYDWNTGALLDATSTNTSWWYETGKRLYGIGQTPEASYKCSSEADSVTGYIGTLTADELVYAGGKAGTNNSTHYLSDNAQGLYWLLSYSKFNGSGDNSFYSSTAQLYNANVNSSGGARPSVTLATGVELLSGDGTQNNPYKIVEK